LSRAPFCILIRHVFIWMETQKLFDIPAAAAFVDRCLEVQDAPVSTILALIPPAWEAMFTKQK
jgi:hypothetical protein